MKHHYYIIHISGFVLVNIYPGYLHIKSFLQQQMHMWVLIKYPFGLISRCLTYKEHCGPLAAVLCESLALIGGAGACAARTAKKKSLTQNTIMASANRETPHFQRAYVYGSKAYQVHDTNDIQKYWQLLKPTDGYPGKQKAFYKNKVWKS